MKNKKEQTADNQKGQEKELEKRIHGLIRRGLKSIRADIPKQEYPQVRIIESPYSAYDRFENRLNISKEDLNSGEVIGEEALGHFAREKLRAYARNQEGLTGFKNYLKRFFNIEPIKPSEKEKREMQVEEFFGYLGRRILKKIATPEDNIEFGKTKTKPRIENQEAQRRHYFEHARPYRFAREIDLDKLNLSKLYALPNQEIRYRFFRQDPQYDLSKSSAPGKITKRTEHKGEGLERIIKLTTSILILLITWSSLTKTTSYTIKQYQTDIPLTPAIGIILLVLITLIIIKFRKKIFKPKQNSDKKLKKRKK